MNRLLFIALFIFLNACSFNIDSKYWNEKSDKKNDYNKLTEIINKSNDIIINGARSKQNPWANKGKQEIGYHVH